MRKLELRLSRMAPSLSGHWTSPMHRSAGDYSVGGMADGQIVHGALGKQLWCLGRSALVRVEALGGDAGDLTDVPGCPWRYRVRNAVLGSRARSARVLRCGVMQIEHTLQWSRDWFEGCFRQVSDDVNKYLSDADYMAYLNTQHNTKLETLTR